MRIEDLVCMDVEGDFRSDVQLSDYDDPVLNRELLKNYIFTTHAPVTFGLSQRDFAAKDVLDILKTAFTVERFENRIVLTANFGRGKSHLALVLANFFTRPATSEEVQIILKRLEQALNNPSQFAGYRDFKKSKGEFLVVRLQGDVINDLQEGFINALERALREHDATRNLELPFWYQHAETWLKSLSGEQLRKAETYLDTQKTDIQSLLINLRRQGSFELVRELSKQVTGWYVDFGREISLDEIVVWAVDEVCIPNKMGGLLILFDEFSLFLQKYMTARSVGKLQELLNGIAKRQGKCAFLAFSQQDVDTIAETYAKGQRFEDVKKELERLPKDKRARLYSLMESVLASYLKQDNAAWETWQPAVKPFLTRAREIVLEHFGKYYSNELQWNVQTFDERVVKGCFPLHPLTTAALSIHNFESGAGENPRTALEFVRRAWQDFRHKPAQLPGNKPNFVFPATLVDFFDEQLSKRWYAAYRNALETSPKALTEEQRLVLKGLLIQQAVGLKAFAGDQIELLTHLCDLEREDIKRVLKELATLKIIQSDPINKVSSLYPVTVRPQEVEEVIQKAVDATRVDIHLMEKITSKLATMGISLGFGHTSDWSPRQVALTAEMCTVEEIKKLIQPFRLSINGIEEGPRGVVIWLIAQSEEEKNHLRNNAQSILDQALGASEHPLPVVMVLPRQAVPALVDYGRRLKALEDMNVTDREKIGSFMYEQEKRLAENNLVNALDDLVDGVSYYFDIKRNMSDYALPSVYRSSVQALRNLSLKSVITECYRQAYAYRVEFFDQYQVYGKGPNKLREATRKVARWLLDDTAKTGINSLEKKDVQYQVSTLYLTQKWGLLSYDTYAIQPPQARSLQKAWDLLEDTFKPGCTDIPVRSALLELLNPPYGHDYNTLTLLLSAWIGFHKHELRLSLSGRVVSLSQLKEFFDESKNPQDFLNRICCTEPLAISRSKPDEMFGQINAVLDQIRQGRTFSISEASEALSKLEQGLENPRLPEVKREEIHQIKPRLDEALRNARVYDQKASEWLAKIAIGNFDELLLIRDSWKELPPVSLVQPVQPSLEELKKNWEAALQTALGKFCGKYGNLSDLADYKMHENELKRARKALEQYPVFAQQVDQTLINLSQRRAELQKQESEKSIVAQINSMAPSAALQVLYEYRETLTKLTDLSSHTATKRDEKLRQIETRIQQYEQIAVELPRAVERVTDPKKLREQRDLIVRTLEQVVETPLYEPLLNAQQKIDLLEDYFEKLGKIDINPRAEYTSEELSAIEAQQAEIAKQFKPLINPVQYTLLEEKQDKIKQYRQKKVQEAQEWLRGLAQRYKAGENPERLIHEIENPPHFLNPEDLTRLTQLKQALQKRLEENVLLQIEALFQKIKDVEARRQCLARLQAMLDE